MDIEKYHRKGKVFTKQIGLKVEPELKEKYEWLQAHINAAEMLRDVVRETLDKCEAIIREKGA